MSRAIRLTLLAAALAMAAPLAPIGATGTLPMAMGQERYPDGAVVVRPSGPVRGVLVVLHGAGEGPSTMVDRLRDIAAERGLVLVAVKSAGDTWDVVASIRASGTGPMGMKIAAKPRLGRDPARIARTLALVKQRLPAGDLPVVIAGFSDGASEALSVGMADPERYRAVIAMSPGLVLLPDHGVMSQKVFIIHGRSDSVLPFAVSKRDIAGLLERVGYRPTFLAFDGDHRIDRASLAMALDAVFGALEPNR